MADLNQIAARIVRESTEGQPIRKQEAPQIASRREAGARGGKARAKRVSPEKRSEIARNAAKTRWAKKRP